MKLTGNHCRCGACGEFFNSTSVFDRHRVGAWCDHGRARRCQQIPEMEGRGWIRNAAGFWIERSRRSAPERLDRTRQSGDLPTGALWVPCSARTIGAVSDRLRV